MSAEIDPAKLKVVELRAELCARGLDSKGIKAVLVKRLKDALEKELEKELPDTSIADTSTEDLNTSQADEPEPSVIESQTKGKEERLQPIQAKTEAKKELEIVKEDENTEISESEEVGDKKAKSEEVVEKESKEIMEEPAQKKAKIEQSPEKKAEVLTENKKAQEVEDVKSKVNDEKDKQKEETVDEKKVEDEVTKELSVENEEEEDIEENGVKQENLDEGSNKKSRWAENEEPMDTGDENKESEAAEKQEGSNNSEQRGDKRKRSPSPTRSQRRRSKSPIKEDEPIIDSSKVQLNWYDSDLHLQIDKESFLSGKPYHDGAFGYVWSGVRATHGADSGKVCYEVKITEELKWDDIIKQPDRSRRDRDRRDSRRDRTDKRDRSSDKKRSGDKSFDKRDSKHKGKDEKKEEKNSKEDKKTGNEEKTEEENLKAEDATGDDEKPSSEDQGEEATAADAKDEKDDENETEKMETTEPESEKQDEQTDEGMEVDENKSDIKPDTEKENEELKQDDKGDEDKKEEDDKIADEEEKKEGEEVKKEGEEEKKEVEEEKKEGEEEKKEDSEGKEEKKEDSDGKEEKKEDGEGKEEKKDKEEKELPPIPTHLIRIGWSSLNSGLQLGESKFSYGFESSGKFVTDKEFSDYGKPFAVGDVIGVYLEFTDDAINIQYTHNGEELPVAISIPKAEVPEENFSLFPHVLSRNYAFEVNLGGREEPFFQNPEPLADYSYIDKFENKVLGPMRPESRSECEVVMMCGLPGSGKTHWVKEHVGNNPDKRYTVIGNTQLLEKMTVNGKPLKNNLKGRWNVVLDKLSKCLNKLVEVAALRRRNYVIDQTNVFPSAQRRKMRPFEGFKRRAVIVVCADEEQARRRALQEAQDGKDVPNIAVYEMKANMSLPKVGEWLEEVTYVELEEQEAKTVVQKYNKEGRDNGFGPFAQRRDYRDDRMKWHQNRRNDYRGGYRDRNYPQSRFDRGSKHGGWQGRSSSSSWNRSDRRDNRGPSGRSREWRSDSSSRGGRPQDRDRNRHSSRESYNRNRNQGGSRSQTSAWQGGSGGGGNWGQGGNYGGSQGAWQGQNNAWSQNYTQGGGGQGKWNYGGQGGYTGQQQSYGNYGNWNYYGQYQNWNAQVESPNTTNWKQ